MPARVPMTNKQRSRLLALPDTEEEAVRHHSLTSDDLARIGEARTPETRLGYALQLCALRYPGRHLRRGELLPAAMLDHIAKQIGVDAEALADFARRGPTRYEQLAAIKRRHGFRDLTAPVRADLRRWLAGEAIGTTDGRVLLHRHFRCQCRRAPGGRSDARCRPRGDRLHRRAAVRRAARATRGCALGQGACQAQPVVMAARAAGPPRCMRAPRAA